MDSANSTRQKIASLGPLRAQQALIRRAELALRRRYATPNLGNKRHVVSELVFIILSGRTRSDGYKKAYRRLRRRFPSWEEVRDANKRELARLLAPAGLSRLKTSWIQGSLKRITKDFGSLSEHRLKKLPNESLEQYLLSLPGVGLKTARCVMMYSADREVFPVDTHCITLFMKLGLLEKRPRMEDAHLLQDLVPSKLRRSLHVNAVAHGQQTCTVVQPRCSDCPIFSICTDPNKSTVPSPRRRSM